MTSSLKWSPLRAHGFFSTLQNFLKFFKNLRDFLLTCFFRKEKRSREEDSSKLKVEFDCCWLMVCTMLINWLNPTIIISYKLLFEVFLFSSLLLFCCLSYVFFLNYSWRLFIFSQMEWKNFWMSSLNWGWLVVVKDDFSVSLFSFSLRNKFSRSFCQSFCSTIYKDIIYIRNTYYNSPDVFIPLLYYPIGRRFFIINTQ